MVLKLLEKVDFDYYELQDDSKPGSFPEYDGKTIEGVTFRRINLATRSDNFPFDKLYEIIDKELESNRYVVITFLGKIAGGFPVYHTYIVFAKDQNNDYLTVTKALTNGSSLTQFDSDIKAKIRNSKGTDILIYRVKTSQVKKKE